MQQTARMRERVTDFYSYSRIGTNENNMKINKNVDCGVVDYNQKG